MLRLSGWLDSGGVGGGSIGPLVASLVWLGGSMGLGLRSAVDEEACLGEMGLGPVGRGGGVGGRLAVGGLRFGSGLRFTGELKEAMRFSKLLARDSFAGELVPLVI